MSAPYLRGPGPGACGDALVTGEGWGSSWVVGSELCCFGPESFLGFIPRASRLPSQAAARGCV